MLCGFQTVAKSFFLCYNRFKRRCGRSNVSFCLEREPPSVKERQGKGANVVRGVLMAGGAVIRFRERTDLSEFRWYHGTVNVSP